MKKKGTKEIIILTIKIVFIAVVAGIIFAGKFYTTADTVGETAWALVPPLVAIVLALITKEVYSSLFIGIITGGLLFSGYAFEGTIDHVYTDGLIVSLTDSYNVGILIFLVILGIIVCLMNRAGGSAAFGDWASKHIKTRVGAQIATIFLGVLIFIDDYFNCLTVGSVMRPVTDKHKVSRAKLSYLIDSTAAPICIIAPVSSWAAAVSGFVPGDENGIALFIKTIPYNFYALLTIVMMVVLAIAGTDFGPMAIHEKNARENDDLFTTPDRPYSESSDSMISSKGKVIDLVIPVVVLVICCIIGMIYTGGFYSGESFINAFANSDASVGLVYGSFFGLVITLILYLVRRVLSFKECMECIPEGFKAMVAPILILTFAWTLKEMTGSLGAKEFVAGLVERYAGDFLFILPFVVFLVAVFLSFATGTSWGTFGILIPIVVNLFVDTDPQMMIIAMSACMAGAVCGDHCSPISDTTIMSSAGAQCNHLNHVSTQIPYALTCAIISGLCYFVAGFMRNPVIPLLIGAVIICLIAFLPRYVSDKK
ncbi:MAG: Na+/H+ antiporter NhaC family protein [Lachnospiraceae bacterium]|nr:Na+/H+ antiporter NhaC family protein [Lachnospiraceae bacterium]